MFTKPNSDKEALRRRLELRRSSAATRHEARKAQAKRGGGKGGRQGSKRIAILAQVA